VSAVESDRPAKAGGPPAPRRGPDRTRALHYAEAAALPILAVLLALFFSVLPATSEAFPTVANLRVTLGNQSVLIIVAMAAVIPLLSEEYDFSVGATTGLGAIYSASALAGGASIVGALAVAVAIGVGVGIVNGLLVTRARVNSVVATLGTATLIAGVVTWKTDGTSIIQGIPDSLTSFTIAQFLGLPRSFWVAVAVTVAAYYLVRHTPFGRYLDGIGSNKSAARLLGLRVERTVLISFVVAGALSGGAGLLLVAQAGAASPTAGPDFTLPAIAAAFLSVAAIQPGRFNIGGAFVAIIFLAILNSGLNLAGASSYVNDFANGGALIAGVALASLFGRRRTAG
jgi:ribose transport system permease protein